MNGILFRALLVGVFTMGSIAVATAQEAPPADQKKAEPSKDEEKKADPAKDDPSKKKAEEEKKEEPAPAEQPKPAEEPKPADQKPAEEPKPAETPAAEPTPAEQPKPAEEPKAAEPPPAPAAAPIETKTPDAAQPADKAASGDDTVAAPQATTTAETTPDAAAGKPWKVSAGLSFSVGSAMFNKNPQIRKPSAGWLLDTSASYTATKLLEGNLDVFGRITMDQVLSNTTSESAVGQTKQFEYFFRDVRLGLTAPNIYKEKITSITISPSTEFFLPTSKSSIAAHRWFHFGLNLRLGRTFEKLGPGDLSLTLGGVFRKPFSSRHVAPDADVEGFSNCRSYAGDVAELATLAHTDCGSGRNSNFTFIEDIGVSYTWGPVTAGISYALYQIRYHRGDLGADLPGVEVGESQYASDNTWTNLSLGAISASYAINDNWSLALSITTYQSPYGTNGYKLRPPFWDPKGENLTTFDLGATFVY